MFDAQEMMKAISTSHCVPQMSSQQIFDIVATHLFTQGKRSMHIEVGRISGRCAYRGDNGLKCAIGVLLPDSVVRDTWDIYTVAIANICDDRNASVKNLTAHKGLLTELQLLHDDEYNWESTAHMRQAFRSIRNNDGIDADILFTLSFSDR